MKNTVQKQALKAAVDTLKAHYALVAKDPNAKIGAEALSGFIQAARLVYQDQAGLAEIAQYVIQLTWDAYKKQLDTFPVITDRG
jgi:hypothetical protein